MIVAAGSGVRFGGPKQLVEIGTSTALDMAIAAAASVSDGVVVAAPPEMIPQLRRPGTATVAGGATRAQSVRRGLEAVPAQAEVILVHDAARPLATPALFRRVVDALAAGEVAVVPVVPVVDSLKRLSEDGSLHSVPREGMFAAQTPQGFRAQVLRSIHAEGIETTDDGGAAEAMGIRVASVDGERTNMKITTSADLVVARALARTRMEEAK
ncbi:MAG: 2-C-methyl-D-erythritol 4-phosphate cytidylyltransferase [Actinomycetota bacterium]|nr:2-C-methyl-D-erythritol 4-phosphate cytidylyltransferase [Actinomycetota bacterium]